MSARKPPELPPGVPVLLTPGEVARLHRVDPKTVTKWAKAGRIEFTRQPGVNGHRRYPSAQFAQLIAVTGWPV